jgi:DNA mismatch endonuclease (patch repair protein)
MDHAKCVKPLCLFVSGKWVADPLERWWRGFPEFLRCRMPHACTQTGFSVQRRQVSTLSQNTLQQFATRARSTTPMDNLTREKRSKVMRSIKGRDTLPELCVRRLVYSMGYRYRIGDKRLPGRPDLVFKSRKKVIFVHGCFWHVHERCPLSHIPAQSFWQKKLQNNKKRDRNAIQELRRECWECLVIWECELRKPDLVRATVSKFLRGSRPLG